MPVEVRKRLGLLPGTLVEFDIRDEGVLLRKSISGEHPVDKVWGTLHLGHSVNEVLHAMRGPVPSELAFDGDRLAEFLPALEDPEARPLRLRPTE